MIYEYNVYFYDVPSKNVMHRTKERKRQKPALGVATRTISRYVDEEEDLMNILVGN